MLSSFAEYNNLSFPGRYKHMGFEELRELIKNQNLFGYIQNIWKMQLNTVTLSLCLRRKN